MRINGETVDYWLDFLGSGKGTMSMSSSPEYEMFEAAELAGIPYPDFTNLDRITQAMMIARYRIKGLVEYVKSRLSEVKH